MLSSLLIRFFALNKSKSPLNRILLFFLIVLSSTLVSAQSKYPKDYFRSPLDIPLRASSYFGDLRTNHFHSGLDLRTMQVVGKNVYAVADGYVSRIRIQGMGFGYALYLKHPNGYTSLYGHLQEYSTEIAAYAKKKQYELESFEADLYLGEHEIPVKKGDVIGLSGNSGGSEGPHLHFELRNTANDEIINPQLFGLSFADKQAPTIKKIYFYRYLSPGTWTLLKELKVTCANGKCYVMENPIRLSGMIGIAIESGDYDDVSGGENGFYSAEIFFDGKKIFHQEMEKFAFAETRQINASIDYERKIREKKTVQRLFLLPNNKIQIYNREFGSGILPIKDTLVHTGELILKDIAGNKASLNLFFQGNGIPFKAKKDTLTSAIFYPEKENTFKANNLEVKIPAGMLYDTLLFEYSVSPKPSSRFYSDIHHLQNAYVPLHSFYTISIKADVPAGMESKLVMGSMSGRVVSHAETATLENGMVSARFRNFGSFSVLSDTTAPYVNPQNPMKGKTMSVSREIRFKISDNLSGVKTYRGTIDGKWVLFEMEGKTNIITHRLENDFPKGEHELRLEVKDRCGNLKIFEANFRK